MAPTFDQGLNLNQPKVTLAPNSFNQLEAVIDGDGTQMNQAQATTNLTQLHNLSNSAYSGSQGVYFDKQTTAGATTSTQGGTVCPSNVTPPCIAGGGFYIEGGADVQLIPVANSNTAQQYKITQNGVVTTITTDPAANAGMGQTTITSGVTTQILNGVPFDAVTGQASTMIYVDGTMYFHGPGEGLGAVQNDAMITLTSNGDAIATGDVLYKTEPVTVPHDALVPGVGKPGLGDLHRHGQFYHPGHSSGSKYRSGRQHCNHFAGAIAELRRPQRRPIVLRTHQYDQ